MIPAESRLLWVHEQPRKARQSVILSGWWVGAKDPLLPHETRSVGGGSFAPYPPPAQDDSKDEIVVNYPS